VVLTTASQHLRAGLDAGLEVEDHGVLVAPDEDGVALDRAELHEPVLDAEAVEPIGEEADGLVVAEVGLAHPALGLGAAHPPAAVTGLGGDLVALGDGEVGTVRAGRAQHDALGLDLGLLGARRRDDLGHREGELLEPLPRGGGDRHDPQSAGAEVLDGDVGDVATVGHVDLVQRHQARPVLEAAVPAELVLDDVEVVERVAAGLDGGGVDDVHDRGAALDVAQEVVAETAPLAGALDEAGHVGDGEDGVAGGHDAEVGHQRREGVVGDLGPGPRDRGDQAGLAGAGEPDEADVGDDLELEDDLELVAGLAEQREPGGLALGGGQRGVAEPAAAALGDDQLGAGADQVGQQLAVLVAHDGAVGHGQHHVLAVGAVAVAAGAVAPVLGTALGAVVVLQQRRHRGVDPQDDRAARAAVAAVGTAEGLELLAVHRGHAVAAAAGADVQRHAVDEGRQCHGGAPRGSVLRVPGGPAGTTKGAPWSGRPWSVAAWSGRSARGASGHSPGTMLTTLRPRRVPNSTAPACSANSVSSPPRPTPEPGWKWVPRWRTMISPALTSWPPKRLTPRR
jgi:hypothetical protein